MIRFAIRGPVLLDSRAAEFDAHLEVGFEVLFSIRDSQGVVFDEEHFSALEFALAVVRWCPSGVAPGEDFEFISVDSEDIGLVWFRRDAEDASRWRVGSVWFPSRVSESLSWDELYRAFVSLCDEIEAVAPERVRSRLRRLFSVAARG